VLFRSNEWKELVTEISQAINSKQLFPTVRSQYMRTAFQIPFDPSVRVSLDTNLCMIGERTKEQLRGQRWFRNPSQPVPDNEITRFPHAVLEVKLQLEDESKTPAWVEELINSGMLLEVHKFSKFIHGCAVLFRDDVRYAPFWIDDKTLAASIIKSGAEDLIDVSTPEYPHLLPHSSTVGSSTGTGTVSKGKAPNQQWLKQGGGGGGASREPITASLSQSQELELVGSTGDDNECVTQYCEWAGSAEIGHLTAQKVEPKLILANERTFIKWLEMAVTMSTISIGVLAFTGSDGKAHMFAMMILPISLLFIGYALYTYLWRADLIANRDSRRWDDPFGPVMLTSLLILALTTQFFLKVVEILYPASSPI